MFNIGIATVLNIPSIFQSAKTSTEKAIISRFVQAIQKDPITNMHIVNVSLKHLNHLLAKYPTLLTQKIIMFTSFFINLPITVVIWSCFLILISVILFFCHKNNYIRLYIASYSIVLILGFFAYLGGLLFMYLHAFSLYCALHATSFFRHNGIYILGWILVVMSFIITLLKERLKYSIKNILIIGILPCFCLLNFSKDGIYLFTHMPKVAMYSYLEQQAKKINQIVPDNSSVYVIWQNDDQTAGFYQWVAVFLIFPISHNMTCPSLGSPLYKNDIWTCNIQNKKQFLELIEDYDYLWLAHTEPTFWANFKEAFSAINSQNFLYKITKNRMNNTISITPIDLP